MAEMDPYKVLGLPGWAGPKEVKQAFRRLAKRYHPDAVGHDPDALRHFMEIKRAYRELSARFSVSIRKNFSEVYRLDLHDRRSQGTSGAFHFVEVEAAEALKGTKMEVSIPDRESFCPECDGLGKVPRSGGKPCPVCDGRGFQEVEWGEESLKVVCNNCSGRGTNELVSCPGCGGRGQLAKERTLTLTIPPGTRDGAVIKVPGQGPWDPALGRRKSIYFEISVVFPKGMVLIKDNILSRVKIDCWTALAGGRLRVDLLDGPYELELPPGTRSGSKFRVKGRGWPRASGGRGDHIVIVDAEMPDSPCPPEAARLLERLKTLWPARGFEPGRLEEARGEAGDQEAGN